MKSFKQFLKEAYKKPDEVKSFAVPTTPTEPFVTTPFEIYKSFYGDQASEIIQKARDYRKAHPGIENRVYLPDYSDAAINRQIVVDKSKFGDKDYDPSADAFVSPNNPDRIAVRDDSWTSVTNKKGVMNSILGHENQHILQMSDTPEGQKLRDARNSIPDLLKIPPRYPLDNDPNFVQAQNEPNNLVSIWDNHRSPNAYRYALDSPELPAHISQIKAEISKKTGQYPYAKDTDELLKHLSGVDAEYEKYQKSFNTGAPSFSDRDKPSVNPTFKDVSDLLKKDPELGLDYWNSVAKRNQNSNQRVT